MNGEGGVADNGGEEFVIDPAEAMDIIRQAIGLYFGEEFVVEPAGATDEDEMEMGVILA